MEGAAQLWEQLGEAWVAALQRGLRGWECESNSAGPGTQGAGTQPIIRPPPGTEEAERVQDSKDSPAPS